MALIRGINVGRAKRVAMADLRGLLADLGYEDIQTLLNSGNVVFSAGGEKSDRIGERIEMAMSEKLGIKAAVTVLTAAAFSTAVKENRLGVGAAGRDDSGPSDGAGPGGNDGLSTGAMDPARFLVAFCRDADRLKRLEGLARQPWGTEALAVGSVAAYLWCASGILKSPLAEAVGRVLGESTTARNWTTVSKIHAALRREGKDE